MYMVTMAATMSSSVLSSEARKASAAPWKLVRTPIGTASAFSAVSIASTAWPSEYAGCEVEGHRGRGELPEVADRERAHALAHASPPR